MRRSPRRTVLTALGAAALVMPTVGTSACTGSWSGHPSHSTWINDVSAAIRPAGAHLAVRLPDPSEKTAIVLDVDNTALESSYADDSSAAPATPPVLALAKQAKHDGAAVFFVTGRDESARASTERNLESVGYPVDGLYLHRSGTTDSLSTYKTEQRIKIEQMGYTIVANVGNNATDLAGGHAEYTVKLPDYHGWLP